MWHALPDDEKLRWGAEAPMVRGDSVERKPRGISIDGRDVSASPRWMQWNRVLDVLTPLASPQFLFEVEITSMRALTLDIGVAETTQSQNLSLDESYKANCREWYVDGAGRAVQKVRNRDKDEVSFAFGRRYGVGRVVGVYRRGSGVGFSLDGVDLGVAFEDVPRNVHPFVRFPTGGVHGQRGDAVRLAAGRPLILTSGEPPPGPLDGRLVVQQFGPELDDWIDLRVNPRRTTVRTLRKLITTVLNARAARVGAEPASPEIVDVHFLKAIAGSKEDPRARAVGRAARGPRRLLPEPLGRRRREAPRPAAREARPLVPGQRDPESADICQPHSRHQLIRDFDDEEDAARAYDAARVKYRDEEAASAGKRRSYRGS